MAAHIRTEAFPIILGEVVAQGVFYQFYDIQGVPHRWAKKLMTSRVKRYPLGVTVNYPMRLYTLIKYGVRDMMEYEMQVAQTMPREVRPYLLQNMILGRTPDGDPVLCADKVLDYDGRMSQTLNQVGSVSNELFWRHVHQVCDGFERHRVYLLGVFHGGNHILVQKISPLEWRPVLLDVVKSGSTMYPFQINLWRDSSVRHKFHRQLQRFQNRFMPDRHRQP
jgi:hypothetical protein